MTEQSGSEKTLKAAFRKVDLRLLAWYCFVHLVMKMNAHNVSNAAIMNIEDGTDIKTQLGGLTSEQWALVLSVSHYPYILLQPASTLLLKICTPRRWMGLTMLSWGAISICQAATRKFSGILTCQFLLGLTETGFMPGVLFHLSFWFPTQRLPMRIAVFFAVGVLSGTASGLFAFSISFLNNKAGLAGWRYLCEWILRKTGALSKLVVALWSQRVKDSLEGRALEPLGTRVTLRLMTSDTTICCFQGH